MKTTEKIKKLREKMVTTPQICVERAYFMTESYKETEGQPNVIRRAKALKKILEKMSIRIDECELLAGWPTSKIRGGALMPEIQWQWILEEMDTFSTRAWDKYQPLTEQERTQLLECLPYWQGKSLQDQVMNMVPEEFHKYDHVVQTSIGFSENGHHFAHVAVDYESILTQGLDGIEIKVDESVTHINLAELTDIDKYHFYKAVKITFAAVRDFARRYAALASSLAQAESDPERQAELVSIAAMCRQVPAKPARNFHEALQSIWLVFMVLMIEGWGAGMSFGRLDQYLNPFYKQDLTAGKITKEQAHELLSLLLIKMNGVINVASGTVATFMGGYPVMQGITVGGITLDGKDAVNEMSYLLLDAEKEVGLNAEDLVVRVNRLTPDCFVIKACETAKHLRGKLKFVSDETTIQSMLTNGIPIDHARNYISTGCHNPTVPAVSHDIGGVSFNLPLMVELALNNGVSRLTGEPLGPQTGDPRTFTSFADVWNAYKQQVAALVQVSFVYKNVDLKLYAQTPYPFQSALFPGCIEKGLDINCGGTAPYATHTTAFIGAPNVGDSLAAVKKAVFDDKAITMNQLIDALDNNFEGCENIRYILQSAPKFGNDEDYVDLLTRQALAYACDTVSRHRTFAGIKSTTACLTMTGNIPMGYAVGALPDGRKAREPLAEGGISPHQGRNISGPTATLRSVAKLDQVKLTNGSILNMRFSADAVKDDVKIKKFVALLRTFCETGGNLVQFNFISNTTLRAAQKNPEQYKDLLVRVATYSAYYVELSPELQNDIIARMEFEEV
ncbi:formate C-acetyltransferase/glycerol dehydratase family glycyl radical enzyme [Sporomusa aerivorans]|uniref:glycyl radical protein n=1 Tax=Sporomusa aerivorans TaxID=204936 RepID=UPI00352B0D33